MKNKMAHIINPFKRDESPELYKMQLITLNSMEIAKKHSNSVGIDVDLLAAFFPEDEDIVPNFFIKTKPLNQSVLNIKGIDEKNKLPFISDILQRMYEKSDAEYLIYSNADIVLMPYFYQAVDDIINQGYESFIINRRTIRSQFNVNQIALMYSEIGEEHPGSDCFVFKREMYKNFHLGKIIIGGMFIGLALRANIITYSNKFKHFRNLHLTFHLGDEREWKNHLISAAHNAEELKKIFQFLLKDSSRYSYQETIDKLYANFLLRKDKFQKYAEELM